MRFLSHPAHTRSHAIRLMHLCLMPLSVLALLVPLPACADSKPQYNIKEDEAFTGTSIRENEVVSHDQVPINKRYDALSDDEKAIVRHWFAHLGPQDEPPYPADGLKPILNTMRLGEEKLREQGQLQLLATVAADGHVSQVQIIHAPSEEWGKFASRVLLLTPFKPALCAGTPCAMDFPFEMRFKIRW